MIPQLKERLAKLEAISVEQERMIAEIRDNIHELRRQLQVEREPQVEKSPYPMADAPDAMLRGVTERSRY